MKVRKSREEISLSRLLARYFNEDDQDCNSSNPGI